MLLLYIIFALIMGFILNNIINEISKKIFSENYPKREIIIFISGIVFLISFLKFDFNITLFKVIVLNYILIITACIDFKYRIIPNKLIIITLVLGILFLFSNDISYSDAFTGMLLGGGILFLLALVPKTMGGGDIKLMFALGLFLGYKKILMAILIAFLLASIISILLLVFRIKERKEYIPFAPFLAVASYISFHFFDVIMQCL